jgi:hypothetical protein
MRILILASLLLAPLAARAESLSPPHRLQLDTDLLVEADRLVTQNQQASSTLPAMMDLVRDLNASSSSSGAGNGPGVLSGVGVGLQVGTPTALTFKFGAGANTNIVLGIGLGFGYDGFAGRFFGLSLHGDYLFTLVTLVNNGTIDLTAYVGPGLWLTLFNASHYNYFNGVVIATGEDLIGIGARLPLGLNLRFGAAPIEIYLELDPALFVFPYVGGFIGASLGFRWFF